MIRNDTIQKIFPFLLTIIMVASLCLFNIEPLKATDQDSGNQFAPGDEIVTERTETAKTYYLDGNSYAMDVSLGAIHYKDNYQDDSEQWKDIDLTFDENNKIIKAPYELTVDTANYSLTIKDKKTGQTSSLKLMKVGSKEIKDISKPAVIFQGKVQWMDIDTDLDLAITADNDRVSFDWIVKSENAPHQVEFEIQDGGIPVTFKGQDAKNKSVDVKVLKNGKNVVESIEKGGKYPKTINPDFQIAASNRDCYVEWTGTSWDFYTNLTNPAAGYIAADLFKAGMGLSYITTIPYQANITLANVKFTACDYYTGVTVRTKFTGQKLPTPNNFTTFTSYRTQRGTVVGGADNTKITTAQVNWDNIGTWNSDSVYTSPNISSIIQEIVNDPGWGSSNKAVVLFWDDHDGRSSATAEAGRDCYSYDGSSTKAPKLHVEYTTGSPPLAPTNVSASDGDYTNKVRITWTASSGATGYKILRYTSDIIGSATQIGASTASPYNDTSASIGTTYYYWVKAYNSYGDSGPSSNNTGWRATPSSLNEAIDNVALSVTTSSSYGWFGQITPNHLNPNNLDSAQSGPILNNGTTWMQTTISGVDRIQFYWKVSSESGHDFLRFYIDGNLQSTISGEVDWQLQYYNITRASHILKWEYTKDGSMYSGDDCGWVDVVQDKSAMGVANSNYDNHDDCPDTVQLINGFLNTLGWKPGWNFADLTEAGQWIFTGDDDETADSVDLFCYAGHGAPGQLILVDDSFWTPHRVVWDEVEWGDNNLEWVMLFACETLHDDPISSTPIWKSNGKFANSLNGAHMICGAYNSMYADHPTDGENVAERLTGSNGMDLCTVREAWFEGIDENFQDGEFVICRVIAEDASYANEYIWGKGSGPASEATVDGNYVGWDHPCTNN